MLPAAASSVQVWQTSSAGELRKMAEGDGDGDAQMGAAASARDEAAAALEAEQAHAAADALLAVPADDSVTHCQICGERFAKDFDAEEEEWMYRGAVRVDLRGRGFIFHKRCYDDQQASASGLDLDNFTSISTPRREAIGAGGAGGAAAAMKQEGGTEDHDVVQEQEDHEDISAANAVALAAANAARKTRRKRARF